MEKSVSYAEYYEFAGFCLDTSNRELLKDGEHVQLTQKCFETLLFLVQNEGRMLQKEEILNSVWQESFVEEANLAQHIYMIRKAFKNAGESSRLIETIPKYGYRFIGRVTRHEGPVPRDSGGGISNSGGYMVRQAIPAGISEKSVGPSGRGIRGINFKSLTASLAFAAGIALAILAIVYIAFSLNFIGSLRRDVGSITVLPFEGGKTNTDTKILSGLANVISKRLSEQDVVKFSQPVESLDSDGTMQDSIDIGKKMNSDAVLFGSLKRANGVFHIHARIVDVETEKTIWRGSFESSEIDLYSLPEAISRKVANNLSVSLPPARFPDKTFERPEAIDGFSAYSVGLHYFEKGEANDLVRAVSYLKRAVEAEPDFASAAANLADVYSVAGYNRIPGFEPEKALKLAAFYANKALSLNPESSQAHSALALVAISDKNYERAHSHFEKSIEYQPDNARARQRLAWLLSAEDDMDGAIDEMRLALESKPSSSSITISLARLLRLNRQADEALKYCKKAINLDPKEDGSKVILAEIYEQQGELDQSVKTLKSVPRDGPEGTAANLLLGRVYAKQGQKEEAIQIIQDLKREGPDNAGAYEIATIYASLGDKKEAVKQLNATHNDSLIHYLHLKYDYNIDSIRTTSDYSKIMTRTSKKFAANEDPRS